jgi:UDP-GlcNAc3NAcA epimerase
MKILRIVGARPQFMQAAMLRKALDKGGHQEILVHTGQHYDDKMSAVFFDELGIPKPDYNLAIGAGSHNEQTGRMLIALDEAMKNIHCDIIVVDGDTNSTLVGALAAAKSHIPLVHVEAGMRCYDKKSPEEINRIITDHVSDVLCAPTETAVQNLSKEGLSKKTTLTGDLMYDCFSAYKSKMNESVLSQFNLKSKAYILATTHRAENTISHDRIEQILSGLNQLPLPVVMPLHPRTACILDDKTPDYKIKYKNIMYIPPVSYLEMLALEHHAEVILTDSGGVQREAYFCQVPSVILRDYTEWTEQLTHGWSILSAINQDAIVNAYSKIKSSPKQWNHSIYGDGHAAEKIVSVLEGYQS